MTRGPSGAVNRPRGSCPRANCPRSAPRSCPCRHLTRGASPREPHLLPESPHRRRPRLGWQRGRRGGSFLAVPREHAQICARCARCARCSVSAFRLRPICARLRPPSPRLFRGLGATGATGANLQALSGRTEMPARRSRARTRPPTPGRSSRSSASRRPGSASSTVSPSDSHRRGHLRQPPARRQARRHPGPGPHPLPHLHANPAGGPRSFPVDAVPGGRTMPR